MSTNDEKKQPRDPIGRWANKSGFNSSVPLSLSEENNPHEMFRTDAPEILMAQMNESQLPYAKPYVVTDEFYRPQGWFTSADEASVWSQEHEGYKGQFLPCTSHDPRIKYSWRREGQVLYPSDNSTLKEAEALLWKVHGDQDPNAVLENAGLRQIRQSVWQSQDNATVVVQSEDCKHTSVRMNTGNGMEATVQRDGEITHRRIGTNVNTDGPETYVASSTVGDLSFKTPDAQTYFETPSGNKVTAFEDPVGKTVFLEKKSLYGYKVRITGDPLPPRDFTQEDVNMAYPDCMFASGYPIDEVVTSYRTLIE